MKNAAIDRTVGKIVTSSDSKRVPSLPLFRQGVSAVPLPPLNFSSSIFRRSASICPRVRCSAGAADGNEVLVWTGAVTD